MGKVSSSAPSAYKQAQHAGGSQWAQYQKSHGDDKAELNDVGAVKAKYRPTAGGVGDAEAGAAVTKAEARKAGGKAWELYEESHDVGERLRGGKDRAGRAGSAPDTGGDADGGRDHGGAGQPDPPQAAVDRAEERLSETLSNPGSMTKKDERLLKTRAGQAAANEIRGDLYGQIQDLGAAPNYAQGMLARRAQLKSVLDSRLAFIRSHGGSQKQIEKLEDAVANQSQRIKRLSKAAADQSLGS